MILYLCFPIVLLRPYHRIFIGWRVYSRQLVRKTEVADRFILADIPAAIDLAERMLQRNEADIVLSIPADFEQELHRQGCSQFK